jgi:hypothetical protein
MKKQSNKNGYAKILKDKVDEIALECGFYKESNNPANLSSNYRDPVLPLLISFYATTGTIGISYCKEPFKWFKGCKQEMIKDIFENPLNYV